MPKILIIRFSSIGDIVLTTPLVRCLSQQLPNAQIHYLTKPAFAGILAPNPHIQKVQTLSSSIIKTIQQLKTEKYDYVIDLHHNQRSLLIKLGLGVTAKSFDKLNYEKWLAVNFKKIDDLPNLHIVDRYIATAQHLGIKNDGQGLDYFIPPKDEVNIEQQFPNLSPQKYIALVIGAAHATKRMPTQKIIDLCDTIKQPIVLLGGKEDAENANNIVMQSKGCIANACGLLNLNQSASVVRQAGKVVSHDTGMMHIAAAFQKPICSVWGNTIPQFGMYPYLSVAAQAQSVMVQVANLPCRPCSKIGYNKCPKGHFNCMQQIDVAAIANFANQMQY
ncbi:MAG: glycosyltransferase family 9 protein [Chitinophagales bacterium]|nr:glycosyltransferase family 9 protein [Chitinophagales bacterium]